jgi:RNA binding exosome subunit
MASGEVKGTLKDKVREILEEVLPSGDVELEVIKEEIWEDLSILYYRYEDVKQKDAFRMVMYNICEKISEGNSGTVYQKIYRTEQKGKEF